MTRRVMLRIDGLKLESIANARWCWQKLARYKKRVERLVYYAMLEAGVRVPMIHARLEIVRVAPRPLDTDNLYASVKPVVDALKCPFGLIVNDDPAHLNLTVRQEHGQYAVVISARDIS